MKIKTILIFLICLGITGCHVMRFKKTADSPVNHVGWEGQNFGSWHHVGIFSLVEFSDPITLKSKDCSNWDSVIVQRGFVPGLVSFLPYVGYIYSPWDAYMKCS